MAVTLTTTGITFPDSTTQTTAAVAGGLAAKTCTFTSSGTWTKPSGYGTTARVFIQAWGGGGSGGAWYRSAGGSGFFATGGGGGGYAERWMNLSELGSTETVTIAAGGAAVTSSSCNTIVNGNTGGNSNFGSWVYAYGGGQGLTTCVKGGGGGGSTSAGGSPCAGGPVYNSNYGTLYLVRVGTTTRVAFPTEGQGGFCGSACGTFASLPQPGFYKGGGGGGGGNNTGGAPINAGSSVYGGGGGGGVYSPASGGGGSSNFAGAGGSGNGAGNGTNGAVKGGGGGGAFNSSPVTSGLGGRGQVTVTVFAGV